MDSSQLKTLKDGVGENTISSDMFKILKPHVKGSCEIGVISNSLVMFLIKPFTGEKG